MSAPLAAGTRVCAKCGAEATRLGYTVRNPELAARIIASVNGHLRASDFDTWPACDDCAQAAS